MQAQLSPTLMPFQDLIKLIAEIVIGLGVFAGGIGYLVSIFKKGTATIKEQSENVVATSDQLTQFWKDQVEGFKQMVAAQDLKLQMLTNDLNKMKGQMEEKEKQNKSYLEILQNRNPEMEQFMKTMLIYQKDSMTLFEQMTHALSVIHDHTINKDLPKADGLQFSGIVTKQ